MYLTREWIRTHVTVLKYYSVHGRLASAIDLITVFLPVVLENKSFAQSLVVGAEAGSSW